MSFLTEHKMFSVLFLSRRTENRRGVPARAALGWALIEESRLYAERQFNQNLRIRTRPLREEIHRFMGEFYFITVSCRRIYICMSSSLDACKIQNPEFTCVTVKPLMPVNAIWKQDREQKIEIGLILETQNVACERNRMHLGRCWWPLARAQLSRSLHVNIYDLNKF